MKKYNFNAGPAALPEEIYEETSKAVLDYNNSSLSIMEIGHRSKEFKLILDETRELFYDLLNIPSGYSVLLLSGGASFQFCMVPYNLLEKKAAFLNTGVWAEKAMKEAGFFGEVVEVASSKDKAFSYIPKEYKIPADADYFHITSNNTVYGTEIHQDIDSPVPLVADMSSDIFSRPIDVSRYDLIYGGAQKNLSIAGMSFVIVRNSILGKVSRKIPSILNYQIQIDAESLYNTPPVTQIYVSLQMLRWLKKQGGLYAIQQKNKEKARLLYNEIDRNPLFKGSVVAEDRSLMNVCFVMGAGYEAFDKDFLQFAETNGLLNLKGYRTVGGFRASIYNAMPTEGVQALVKTMQDFEKKITK